MSSNESKPSESSALIRKDLQDRKKVQTAEGWRRSVLKARAENKSRSGKK